jgi:hypothetical protein
MMKRPRIAPLLGAGAAFMFAALLPVQADTGAKSLQPYTARYQVSYRGLNGGEIEATFKRGNAADLWLYETRAFPSLLGSFALGNAAGERSTMQVTPEGVQPLQFEFNDGKSGQGKDVSLRFDWENGRVTGKAEGKPVDLELSPGVQDTASVQAAMIKALAAGHKPTSFTIVASGKIREYRYWNEGSQQVMTPFGQVQAEVWASQRDGSNRVTKTWHAPSLGYVPVQAIQYRKGNPELQMKLVKLQR